MLFEGGQEGRVLPHRYTQFHDAAKKDVDLAMEGDCCGAMRPRLARLDAVAEGVAVAGRCSGSFALFGNIIVRRKTMGGPPSRPFTRGACGGFRENRGWGVGEGASVAHGDEVGVDKGCSRAVIFGVRELVARYPTPVFAKSAASFAFWRMGCWIRSDKAVQIYFQERRLTAQIVLLNGASSVGKTSIGRAVQAQAAKTFLHVQMDTWLEMMPQRTLGTPEGLTFQTVSQDGKPAVIVTSGVEQERALRGMRHAIAAMAALDCNMVVDDVMFDASVMDEYRALLSPYDLKIVGVFAPLEVLEAREKARGDRDIGLARWQFEKVHRGMAYDLEIDAATASAEECAAAIVARFGL